MESEEIYRLAKPKKSGLLSLLCSRLPVIILLLLLEILASVSFYGGLYRQFPWFSWGLSLFTLAMILYLFDSRMDASAKLT